MIEIDDYTQSEIIESLSLLSTVLKEIKSSDLSDSIKDNTKEWKIVEKEIKNIYNLIN